LRERFNPELFAYDPARTYAWQPFQRVTATVITWNRLEWTKVFFDTLRRRAGMPLEVLAIDNASEDGTPEYLAELAATWPGFRVIQNRRNVGKSRAMLQIQKELTDGLAVMFDSDIELLSNYWLVHLQKAYHAARLRFGNTDVAFGLRPLNCEEYGFGFTYSQEILPIPHAANDLPRTSYAAVSKDSPDKDHLLDEQVIVGWTGHLMGNNMNMPVSVLKRLRLDELYPVGIGADDTHVSAELKRLKVPFGYIQNGPIVRHNDWPYTDEKVEIYTRMMQTRMVTDLPYVRWKLKALVRKLRGR
jgi:glycosyltransferase involved in cell wall biosynthesis